MDTRPRPCPRHHAPELAVVESEQLPFHIQQEPARKHRHSQGLAGQGRCLLVKHQPADVVEQAGHEKPLRTRIAQAHGQKLGHEPHGHAMAPKLAHIHADPGNRRVVMQGYFQVSVERRASRIDSLRTLRSQKQVAMAIAPEIHMTMRMVETTLSMMPATLMPLREQF